MAEQQQTLRDPWLVAAWSGMGGVGATAAGYLVEALGAQAVGEIESHEFFEIEQVTIKSGLASASRPPRSLLFEWKDPDGRRDLVVFVGEAQPSRGGQVLCQRLLDYARQRGVTRVVTFAAMATQLHPADAPRVFGAATDHDTLMDLRRSDVAILGEGQISGLNGVLLAAGAEAGLPGMCLLGELPFFAVGVPNPRSAQAILQVFSSLTGIGVDLETLADQAEQVQEGLLQLLEQMKRSARESGDEEELEAYPDEPAGDEEETATPAVDDATRRRIEMLFEQARADRGRAMALKELLDRLDLFGEYEDRFLDLFRKGE
ncbi:MAG: proteasome assembly chaperone family protein [Planctomycetota bacterium]|jgi:proteasome assembly chaperone (PAC2) family protein